jgi:hypothetical protein
MGDKSRRLLLLNFNNSFLKTLAMGDQFSSADDNSSSTDDHLSSQRASISNVAEEILFPRRCILDDKPSSVDDQSSPRLSSVDDHLSSGSPLENKLRTNELNGVIFNRSSSVDDHPSSDLSSTDDHLPFMLSSADDRSSSVDDHLPSQRAFISSSAQKTLFSSECLLDDDHSSVDDQSSSGLSSVDDQLSSRLSSDFLSEGIDSYSSTISKPSGEGESDDHLTEIEKNCDHKKVIISSPKYDPIIYNNIVNNNSVDTGENFEDDHLTYEETSLVKQIFDLGAPLLSTAVENPRALISSLIQKNKDDLETVLEAIKVTKKTIETNANASVDPLSLINGCLSHSSQKLWLEEDLKHRRDFIASVQNQKLRKAIETNESNEHWLKLHRLLLKQYGRDIQRVWFVAMYLAREDSKGLLIGCSSEFIADWLKKEYLRGVKNREGLWLRRGIREYYEKIVGREGAEIKLLAIKDLGSDYGF